jgi:hypothetical protein
MIRIIVLVVHDNKLFVAIGGALLFMCVTLKSLYYYRLDSKVRMIRRPSLANSISCGFG